MAANSHVVSNSSYSKQISLGKELDRVSNFIEDTTTNTHEEEEEEIDLHNDETFGDVGDYSENWEEEHQRFATEEENLFDLTEVQCREITRPQDGIDKNFSMQDEYMEKNISQLVVEDDELEDPAILNISKNKPVYEGSSGGPNIWGSPKIDTHIPVSQPSKLQALFDFAKAATSIDVKVPIKTQIPIGISSIQVLSPVKAAGTVVEEVERKFIVDNSHPPRVLAAADLERQLRGEVLPSQAVASQPSPLQPFSPQTHSLQHVLQQAALHQSPQAPPAFQHSPVVVEHRHQFSVPLPIPTLGSLAHTRQPLGFSPVPRCLSEGRMSPLTLLANNANSITPPAQNRQSPLAHSLRQSPAFGMTSPIVGLGRTTPTPPLSFGASPPVIGSPLQARLVSPFAFLPAGTPRRIYPSPLPGTFMRNQAALELFGSHPGTRMPSPQGVLGGDTAHVMVHSVHPHPRYPSNCNQHRTGPLPFSEVHMQRNHQQANAMMESWGDDQGHTHSGEDDYAGLMTQKEKDWIIKIQLLQLQTDNPHIDDYYYTRYMMKKKAKERQKQKENGILSDDIEPTLLMPAFIKFEGKAYTPAHFEGSLGRLTTSSVHNPRHIIDIKPNAITSNDEMSPKNVSKELRRFRQLLMDIEKGFTVLLDIDDLEKQVLALPEESRDPLLMERRIKIEELFKYFTSDENFESFMQALTVKKGRKLLARAMPLFDKMQAQVIVSLTLLNVPNLIKKDQTDESLCSLGEAVSKAIENTSFEALVKYAEYLQKETAALGKPLTAILQNKFGCLLLCSLLQRGEDIYQNTSPVDMDSQLQTVWSQFVEDFAESLAGTAVSALIRPEHSLPGVAPHLQRFLHPKVVSRLEDKVSALTVPTLQTPVSVS